MYKIGVIGERDSVIAFLATGITVKNAENAKEAEDALESMAKEGYGLIFVTETTAANIKEAIEKYKKLMLPVIILIPGVQGSLGIGVKAVKENVEKAVGVDILSRKEG